MEAERSPPEAGRFEQLARVLGGLEGLGGEPVSEGEAHGGAAPGRIAVAAYPLDGGLSTAPAIAHRAHEPFTAASTIKVFILLALLERVAEGGAALEEELVVGAADQVGGAGVLKELTPGRRFTLLDLATLMIVVSDNTATNVLVEYLGVDAINASIQSHGWRSTRSAGKLMLPVTPGEPARRPSVTSAADLADHFAQLWRGELLPEALSEVARSIYRRQQFSYLGRSMDFGGGTAGYDRYAAAAGEAPWRIASKTGSVRGVRHDPGVFEPLRAAKEGGKAFVIAVMTDGCVDERYHPENLGERVVGWAAAEVYQRLWNAP